MNEVLLKKVKKIKKAKSNEGFATRLSLAMELSGLSNMDIAKNLHHDDMVVYNWIHGKNLPNSTNLMTLCNILGVSADYLLFGENRYDDMTKRYGGRL